MVELITVNSGRITPRVWGVVRDAAQAAGVPLPRVMQGSYSKGVQASAGTHDGGGVVDLSIAGMSSGQQVKFVEELRRRNGCAWLRTPAHGWSPSAGAPHCHMVVRDEPGLSTPAQTQVRHYDQGLNGLASRGRDTLPRPKQYPVEEVRMASAFPKIGSRKIVKPTADVTVKGGQWVKLASIDLPAGVAYTCILQIRMPTGVGAGEAVLGRRGWGDAKAGDLDETGGNEIRPASSVRRWRTPITHNVVGGGPLEFLVYLPAGTHKVRFVAKAVRAS
jgi:hypothetical protein